MAHGIVIMLKEMGLPQVMDDDLASLSTDLGDLWSAQKTLADHLEEFLNASGDWETIGSHLVDMRSSIDHIAWHLKTVRRPLNKITQYAFREADKPEK